MGFWFIHGLPTTSDNFLEIFGLRQAWSLLEALEADELDELLQRMTVPESHGGKGRCWRWKSHGNRWGWGWGDVSTNHGLMVVSFLMADMEGRRCFWLDLDELEWKFGDM